MFQIFKRTEIIINQIDDFLNTIEQSGMAFSEGVRHYVQHQESRFDENLHTVSKLEARADELRRNVETTLYQHSLLPEYRGDVLNLLERMDDIADAAKENLVQFDVEKPLFPNEVAQDLSSLAESSANSVSSLVMAARAFFRDVKTVKDHLHKVHYYEREADKIGNEIKRYIFQKAENLHLSQRNQLRYFTHQVENLSDIAENVADMLNIYSIKRMV